MAPSLFKGDQRLLCLLAVLLLFDFGSFLRLVVCNGHPASGTAFFVLDIPSLLVALYSCRRWLRAISHSALELELEWKPTSWRHSNLGSLNDSHFLLHLFVVFL